MKISIIIPVYKVEAYLRDCLDSVLRQTFSDYEAILVDDGSPDGCGAICDEYAARDSRFRVIHKENGGLSSARNAALDTVRGEFVYFLDSDDTIVPSLLETVVPIMERGADQVIFQHIRMRDDGTTLIDKHNVCGTFHLDSQEKKLDYLLNKLIPCEVAWTACTSVFSMDKIRKYGQRFADNRVVFAEDMQFALCYCAHADMIVSIENRLYNYRLREDSIMGVQLAKSNLGRTCLLARSVEAYYRRFDDCSLLTEQFPAIYYQLVAGQFLYQMWASGVSPAQYRKLVREEVEDWEDMEQKLRTYLKENSGKHTLRQYELRANVLFLLDGSERALRLRCAAIRALRKLGLNG